MTHAAEIRDIVVEAVLPHAPEVVWKTLTTADLIGQWLMPNDFALSLARNSTSEQSQWVIGMASYIAKFWKS